jgi:hypothetical protein
VSVREDALYLAATIHRQRADDAEAARLLATLSHSDRSATARLAQLERGRLLAGKLAEPSAAREAFRAVLAESTSDALAAQAFSELCASWLEAGQVTEARACLDEAVHKLPAGPERERLQALLVQLDGKR